MLQQILKRIAFLLKTDAMKPTLLLHLFLNESFKDYETILDSFLKLDDADISFVIKQGQESNDPVLKLLCNQFMQRNLWEIKLNTKPFDDGLFQLKLKEIQKRYVLYDKEANFLVWQGTLVNNAYMQEGEDINILMKNGQLLDVTKASDNYNLDALKKKVTKYFIAWSN